MKKQALDIVLSEFYKIAEIPRPSHHEARIGQYLQTWAQERGLTVRRDALGTVVIDKPASPGLEQAPRVILQAHMDMVCVAAEGVTYDPLRDPIRVLSDGETLRADGTSLGADDGIGIAMCLYLLQDDSLRHGPLRAIFTTNEEDGMDSIGLDAAFLDGSYLINLDWETIGSLCNSCAGGDFFNFRRAADWSPTAETDVRFEISLSQLMGGHSGVGINKGHANALVSIATALCVLRQGGVRFRIADFRGGQAKNAIPAFGTVELVLGANDSQKAMELLGGFETEFRDAFGNVEPELELCFGPRGAVPARALSEETSYALSALMCAVPNNVHTMSPFVEGLVESSSNLGVIALGGDELAFTVFARSSVAYQATQLGVICRALAARYGFDLDSEGHVPGWAVNPNSRLTAVACEAYVQLTGQKMVVEPVHAGVECGAFAEKNPQLDMIAIGPTLIDVHTPNETCCIRDVETITELLVRMLNQLAE